MTYERMMQLALRLARRGYGTTSPNPNRIPPGIGNSHREAARSQRDIVMSQSRFALSQGQFAM